MAYYIEKGCVGCHYCKLECPANAIRVMDGRYQIDQEKCIACGKCVELCHLDLIKNSDKPESFAPHDPITLNCDLLVVGAGGVGTGAAARGADLGLDVVMIEAAKHYGGGTYLAHGGQFPGSVELAKKLGFDGDLEGAVKRWAGMKKNGVDDMDKLRQNVAANGQFIDWFDALDKENTAPFTLNPPGHPVPLDMKKRHMNVKSQDDSIGPGWMGSWITDRLFDAAMKKGVRYYNKTRARHFIVENGKVVGVEAEDGGGKLMIYAKAIILGTGGYMMNDDRLRAIDPDLVKEGGAMLRLNVPTNVGDGHDMVSEIGGDVDYTRGGSRGPTHHPYSFQVNRMLNSPQMLFFGDDGKRLFEMSNMPMAGGEPTNGPQGKASEIILRTKHGRCYVILDSDLLEELGSALPPLDTGDMADWRKEIEDECALEDIPARKADTIAALAKKLGMPEDSLVNSISRWNSDCDKGVDTEFGKDKKFMHKVIKAPFYAFVAQNFDNGASRGGVSIDADFRVLTKGGKVISGVYCSGDAATYSWTENIGPTGLCGGLGGSWASGFHIAELAKDYIEKGND